MPSEFPLPSVSGSNPIPLYFELLPEQFSVGSTEYDDMGKDYKLQHGGSGVKTWIIKYAGLTIAEFTTLKNWAASMFYSEDEGSAYGANLRHHIAGEAWTSTNGTLYSGVHIAPGGYKTSHEKVWSNVVEFVLEKRP